MKGTDKRLKFLVTLICFCGVFFSAITLADVPVPTLTARVTDLTNTLSRSEISNLEQKLTQFEKEHGSQIAVLLVPTTEPETIEQYSMRVVEAWKLGRKKLDDGVLLLIAKKDRAVRIEVGYGLEGAIPDVIAKRIITKTLVPYFKQGDFYGGIDKALSQLIKLIQGENLGKDFVSSEDGADKLNSGINIVILMVVLGVGLSLWLSPVFASVTVGTIGAFVAWFVLGSLLAMVVVFLVSLVLTIFSTGAAHGAHTLGTSWSSGGGSSHWGGGGGGFSGGGGSFGGGGSSGRW